MEGLERTVVLVNDLVVRGKLRLQKYGFIAAHLYKKDLQCLDFYRDWKALRDGPYSYELAEDLRSCIDAGIIDEAPQTTPGGNTIYVYTLKPKGRRILCELTKSDGPLKIDLYKKFVNLDRRSMNALLKDVYKAYPEYTEKREIKNGDPESIDASADRNERFNPEIECILESIDSGTYVGEKHTIDEYIKYVKKVLK